MNSSISTGIEIFINQWIQKFSIKMGHNYPYRLIVVYLLSRLSLIDDHIFQITALLLDANWFWAHQTPINALIHSQLCKSMGKKSNSIKTFGLVWRPNLQLLPWSQSIFDHSGNSAGLYSTQNVCDVIDRNFVIFPSRHLVLASV